MTFHDSPIPAQAGVGLKPIHYEAIIDQPREVAWFEIHPENYFADGGLSHRALHQIRTDYPLTMHGVGMSLGSEDGLDTDHLKQIKALIDRYNPAIFSEHLSWSRFQHNYSNDLLPIPYTKQAFARFKNNVNAAQDYLNRQILIENPSSYFMLNDNDYTEWDFLVSLCRETGAGLLLDINNVYVSSINHGFDANEFIAAIPPNLVGEIHLAGHAQEDHTFGKLLIDDHGSAVCNSVWELYRQTIARMGATPTLIEWDTNIPQWHTLVEQARQADAVLHDFEATMA